VGNIFIISPHFFIDNTIYNAYEYLKTSSNCWDNGSSGNLWSNYDEPGEGCIDMDNNGICNLAYVIPGSSGIDHYPMIHSIYKWTGEGSTHWLSWNH
jgi:nitrous oxidase accessory protein NosD